MATKSRNELKGYFLNGLRPDEDNFAELIDSLLNREDDHIFVNAATKSVGLDVQNPIEKLEIGGAVRIGNSQANQAGTIRWTGTDFEGNTGADWKSMTLGENIPLVIPRPRLEVQGPTTLFAYWEDTGDRRFLEGSPRYFLYRYKSRIVQTYRDGRRRLKPKGWVHPEHRQQTGNLHTAKNTVFTLSDFPGALVRIDLQPSRWFRSVRGIPRPKGQGRFIRSQKHKANRRFEYFKLRIVTTIAGKPVMGPFSETFSLGYRKDHRGTYVPVIEIKD